MRTIQSSAISVLVGILVAGIILVIFHYKPWKKMSGWGKGGEDKKKESWSAKHPMLTRMITVIVVIVASIFLPEILRGLKLVGTAMIAGLDNAFRGTPRSQWGMPLLGAQPEPVVPTQSIGGTLRWNKGAVVKERPRVSSEKIVDGVAFTGVMVPNTKIDKRFTVYHDRLDWSAFLVDRTTSNRMLSPGVLTMNATTKRDVPVGVLALPYLSSVAYEEVVYLKNETGTNGKTPAISEHYMQVINNGPCTVEVSTLYQDPKIFEYEVTVGGNETEIIVPTNWKWLWVVPVHHREYQSQFFTTIVPACGVSYDEATRILLSADPVFHSRVKIIDDAGYRQDWNFQSILLERGGTTSVLEHALLLKESEMEGNRITVRLNIPKEAEIAQVVKPAKILVGIQMY